MKHLKYHILVLFTLLLVRVFAQDPSTEFKHPGGLHTIDDLNRMKEKVAENAHPWIDGWNLLIQDPLAQSTYQPKPLSNLGSNRGVAARDAHAAYLNAIRWYISGDAAFANCAVNIINAWSLQVNQIPTGGEIWGLGGISISSFALAAEVLRIYDGWKNEDFMRFKSMMLNYMYPLAHDFLQNHHGACIDYFWANWDANNILALVSIGVLCDNREIYNEGIEYYKHGEGTGSIKNAVYYIHENGLGQWQESGRDQEHAQLGVGLLGYVCQIAWNQGLDLFSYDHNRLLAGAEYVAKYNQNQSVPFKFYNNCQPANHQWPAINGRGRLDDRPVWELMYNHYAVHKGLEAKYTQRMAELMRPEHGSYDHFGYGTLTFTLDGAKSAYPPSAIPNAPTKVLATPGLERIALSWNTPSDSSATGYEIQRASSKNGPFKTIAKWNENTSTFFVDHTVEKSMTYYYKVAAINQSGTSSFSNLTDGVQCEKPFALSKQWSINAIGNDNEQKAFMNASANSFIITGSGQQFGGAADEATFCSTKLQGDFEFTCQISDVNGVLNKTGIMVREDFESNAPCVSLTVGEAGGRFARMGYRKVRNTKMESTLGNTYTWLPAWFRIKRKGNVFIAYESSDGVQWFEIDQVEIAMHKSCWVGFVSTSQQGEVTTVFQNVSINR